MFVEELQRNFGLEDELGAAEEDLRKLTMSDKDHATFFSARFRAVVATLNGTWNDRTLRNQYYQKITPHLRAQFVSAGVATPATLDPLIATLDPLIATVEHFDRAYWADIEVNRAIAYSTPAPEKKSGAAASVPRTTAKPSTDSTATNSKSSAPRQSNAKPAAAAHLTKEGKLTAEEKQRRIESGACFYCGEVGHLATACTKKTSQPHARAADSASAPRQSARTLVVVLNESDDSGNE